MTSTSCRCPAVVTVQEGLNLPRYPSVPGRLRAQRKPVDASTPARPDSRLEKLRLVVPEGQGKEAEILGHGPEAAPAVVDVLARDRGALGWALSSSSSTWTASRPTSRSRR